MSNSDKAKRFRNLTLVPRYAAADHRFFLGSDGKDHRFDGLNRAERRKMKAESKKIAAAYERVVRSFLASGAGYSVDQLLRQFAFEYTHRYAASGLYNQPSSFNYIEAFCDIKLIENSYAPYTEPVSELDHLFSIVDYLDYLTGPESISFE